MRNLTTVAASALAFVLVQFTILLIAGGAQGAATGFNGFATFVAITGSMFGAAIGATALVINYLSGKSSTDTKSFAVISAVASLLVGIGINLLFAATGGSTASTPGVLALTFDITVGLPFAWLTFLNPLVVMTAGALLIGAITGTASAYATRRAHGVQ